MSSLSFKDVVTEQDWHILVESLAEGRLSMFDVIGCNRPQPGDYFHHVQSSRALMMLLSDTRILKRLHEEVSAKLDDKPADKRGEYDFNSAAASKDGLRRFKKMLDLQNEMAGSGSSLLNGTTFDECLQQYQKITGHLEQLWIDSRDLYLRQHYPLATFTAILLLEEMGKVGQIWRDLLNYAQPRSSNTQTLETVSRSHRQKAFIAVVAGSIVNSRLDRILGLKAVQQVLQDAASGKLEVLRQACLYIDQVDGNVKVPGERVDESQAKLLVVLSSLI